MNEIFVELLILAGTVILGVMLCIKAAMDAVNKWREYLRVSRGNGYTRAEHLAAESVGELAVTIALAERQPLSSKHLVRAHELYAKIAKKLGHSTKDEPGLMKLARKKAEGILEG